MSNQLDLMFDLLQREIEEFTADLNRDGSDDPLHSTLDETSSPLKLDVDFYSMEVELERSLTRKHSSNSISDSNNSSSLQPPTNSHRRSASHNDVDDIKSNSAESRYSNNLSPVSPVNFTSTQLSSEMQSSANSNYQRIISLSENSNIALPLLSPIISPLLSPRMVSKTALVLSSDSDVSVSSSDDTSESDDSDNSPLIAASSNLLRKQSLSALTITQNSSVNSQNSIILDENNSTIYSSPTSTSSLRDFPINVKKIQRRPTTGRSLSKSPTSPSRKVYETSTNLRDVNRLMSHDTDDENRPLRSRSNSGTLDIDFENQREDKQTVVPRTNLRAQEPKKVNENSTNFSNVNRSNSHDTDDENRPLRPKVNTRTQDTNLEKKREEKQIVGLRRVQESKKVDETFTNLSVHKDNVNKSNSHDSDDENRPLRPRANSRTLNTNLDKQREEKQIVTNSRTREQNLDIQKDRVHRNKESIDRRSSSKEKEYTRDRSRSKYSDDHKTRERRSDDREDVNRENGEKERQIHSRDHSRGRAKSRTRVEDKERTNVRENLEERGRGSNRNIEQDNDRGRAKSKVYGEEERGRARSKARGEEERERAKSKTREEERGRTRSSQKEREVEERSGRAKSRTQENDNRERAKSRTRREKSETHVEKEQQKINEVKVTAQIFIEDVRQYRKLSIAPSRTALDILNFFRSYNTISDNETWTLFEVINEYGLERPIRDWEYVATIIGSWELSKPNALVLKKYPNRSCLTLEGFNNAVPPMFGWLHLEVKKNKWQKRHFYIKDGAVYHCKDVKGNNETLLCSLMNFDVYTFTKAVKKSPTKFIFALKSQDRLAMFEKPDDYIRYLCADHLDKMKDWVLSLRAAKNTLIRAENPERFIEKPIEKEKKSVSDNHDKLTYLEKSKIEYSIELNADNETNNVSEKHRSSRQWENLRRYVRNSRSDNLLGHISNSSTGLKNQSSNNTTANLSQPFTDGSLLDLSEKNPPPKQVEQVEPAATFAAGSLLASSDTLFDQAKERDKLRKVMGGTGIIRDPNSPTFINLDNSVTFNQGSLLDKNNDTKTEHSNNSGHLIQIEDSVDSVQFNKGSLLTKHKEPMQTGYLVPIEDGVQFNKGSLLTKIQESNEKNNNIHKLRKSHSETLLKIDAPLSKDAMVQKTLSPNGKTLLELDLKPDAAHTLALRNTNIKPLLSFVPGEHDNNLEGARNLLGNNKNNNLESESDSEYDSDNKL